MNGKIAIGAFVCFLVLAVATPNTSSGDGVKVVQLDNVWLQELKVRMGGGTWGLVTYSGYASSVWGYDELSGGIYDNFVWFENGAYVVEGEHVIAMVEKQELDFWAGGNWYEDWDEKVVRPSPAPEDPNPDIYYPDTAEHYLYVLENYVFYFDQAYVVLRDLFGADSDPAFADESGRLVILYVLGCGVPWGFADYPITIGGADLNRGVPDWPEVWLPFHEIGHTFTGGGEWVHEYWAEFCATYIVDRLGLENLVSGGLPKHEMLYELGRYGRAGAPFENAVRGETMIFENSYVTLPIDGILFALGENFGYEKFRDVRFGRVGGATYRDDAISLMYQLYPGFGENMWPFFERWNFPVSEDTDNDGMNNRQEIEFGSSPLAPDSDSDYLNDPEENAWGTDPWLYDTDNDHLRDGEEVNLHGTNPLLADSDGDGINDYDEVYGGSTQPEPGFQWYDYLWVFGAVVVAVLALGAILVRRRDRKRDDLFFIT